MTAVWTVHTDVFDGPLDLLLHLVRRDGVDLRTMPIAPIADAYLAYLDRMRELHLGVASEYLVMAATLVHLKSLELLPRKPTVVDERGEDPKERLVAQLLAWEAFRRAADDLDGRELVGRDVFVRAPAAPPRGPRPLAVPDAFSLLDTYYALLQRRREADTTYTVDGSGPDVEECCRRVLASLRRAGGRGELGGLLRALPSAPERVVTFVGVLEMARLGWVDVSQRRHLGPVELTLHARADVDLEALSGRVERAVS